MEDPTLVVIVALIILAVIIIVALILGINGTALASALAIIGACVGYEIKAKRGE